MHLTKEIMIQNKNTILAKDVQTLIAKSIHQLQDKRHSLIRKRRIRSGYLSTHF